jgi:hypothetical protein
MALIYAIDSTMDSTFAIPTTKESTFASMVAFHSTSSGGLAIFTFFGHRLLPSALLFTTTNQTPMLLHSNIS